MTPDQKIHIQYLLARYLNGTIAAGEEQQLFNYIEEEKDNSGWQELLEEFMASEQEIIINREEYQPILEKILGHKEHKRNTKNATIIPLYKRKLFRWIAAASIIIIAVATIVIARRETTKQPPVVATTHDVPAPTNTRAVITLANGTKVYLDSVNNGTIATENNVNVIKKENGEIVYSHEGTKTQSEIVYNTLFNPRGSKVISLTLSDGTKVWLNSESSLRYPASFAPPALNREVEITGEAYFEVKHNSKQPFKVHLPSGSIVEDIGTSFNINSYSDEDGIKTTLIEGSVKVSAKLPDLSFSTVILKPNQQSVQIPQTRAIRVQNNIDIEDVLSWKNGTFSYTNSDLETIMRQMARWYDVEVIYKDKITDHYTVDVPRTVPVSQLFKFIEMSGGVHFEIEGKKIIVSK